MKAWEQKARTLSVLEGARPYLARAGLSDEGLRIFGDAQRDVVELVEAARIALNYLPENGLSRERLMAALARFGG